MSNAFAQPVIEEVDDMLGRSFGVIDQYVNQFVEWVKSLDLAGWGKEQLHLLLHYLIETAIPTLIKKAPDYVQVITLSVALPLMKKLDEAYFHAT